MSHITGIDTTENSSVATCFDSQGKKGLVTKGKQFLSIAALAVFLATTSSGCGSIDNNGDDEYAQVCYDEKTDQRVEDDKCPRDQDNNGSSSSGFIWGWIAASALGNHNNMVPAVGSRVYSGDSGFTRSRPSSGSFYNPPKSGGSFDDVRAKTTPQRVGSAAEKNNKPKADNGKKGGSSVNKGSGTTNKGYSGGSRGGGSFGGSRGGGSFGG